MPNKTEKLPTSLDGLNAVEESNIYGFLYAHCIFKKIWFSYVEAASFSVLMDRAWAGDLKFAI